MIIIALILAAEVAGPAAPEFRWSFLDERLPAGTMLTPCPRDGSDAKTARETLARLDKKIAALSDAADPRPMLAALDQLLATPCFKLARLDRPPTPQGAAGLKHWWTSGGGLWFQSFPELATTASDTHLLWVSPPDVVSPAPSELEAVLCAASDAACGAATAGWTVRAAQWFELHRLASERPWGGMQPKPADCTDLVLAPDDESAFQRWSSCLRERQATRTALPLGRFRVPSSGWLIISGRRGHYEFCDEVRAYSLATGAAWIVSSCSGLVLSSGGNVDFDATDRTREQQVRSGHVSLDNLREAMWAMLVAPYAKHGRISSQMPVPPQLPIRARAPIAHGGGPGSRVVISDAQTSLTWSWRNGATVLAKGSVTWPSSSSHADGFATHLLAVAESSLVEACVDERPLATEQGAPRVSGRDADPETHAALMAALSKSLSEAKPCAAAPGPSGP